MLSTEEQLARVEVSEKQAKEVVDTMAALVRLTSNPDFKKIIDDGYLEKEALRLTYLLSDPSAQEPATQEATINSLRAIAELRQYFGGIIQKGRSMERELINLGLTREELLLEEQEEG